MSLIDNVIYQKVFTPNHFSNPLDKDVWVIGDVHGCLEEYKQLVSKVRERDPDCVIIQLGDLIDRGPADLYDLFVFNEHQLISNVIGNHEFNFLIEYYKGKPCNSKARRETHDMFNAYDVIKKKYILECMNSMNNYITTEVDGIVWALSHAPIRSGFAEYLDCGSASVYCMSTTPYTNDVEYSVHGHMHWNYTPIENQLTENKTWFNIDSGAVYGNYLLAFSLKTREYIKVQSSKYASH